MVNLGRRGEGDDVVTGPLFSEVPNGAADLARLSRFALDSGLLRPTTFMAPTGPLSSRMRRSGLAGSRTSQRARSTPRCKSRHSDCLPQPAIPRATLRLPSSARASRGASPARTPVSTISMASTDRWSKSIPRSQRAFRASIMSAWGSWTCSRGLRRSTQVGSRSRSASYAGTTSEWI